MTATNSGGIATAELRADGRDRPEPPVDASPPAHRGHARVGAPLTPTTGTFTGSDPLDYAYSGSAATTPAHSCVDIPGATADVHAGDAERARS